MCINISTKVFKCIKNYFNNIIKDKYESLYLLSIFFSKRFFACLLFQFFSFKKLEFLRQLDLILNYIYTIYAFTMKKEFLIL